jgi:hypothetical protein
LDEQLAQRSATLERMVTDRLSALQSAVDEARRQLEAARSAQEAELDKAVRGRADDMERLVGEVREVERAVARRLGDLERRTVDSGAALEDLLGRVGELARASTALGRASGGRGEGPAVDERDLPRPRSSVPTAPSAPRPRTNPRR